MKTHTPINRYADLMKQIADSSVDGTLVTLEVGSRGFLSLPNFNMIKQQLLKCSREAFLVHCKCAAIQCSHKIWVTRNWTDSQPHP